MTVHALVVGSLVMDLAFHVPRRPGPGEVVVATEHGTYRGGKGYNQAVALSRLGARVTMVGAVGRDAYGDGFLRALEREGVDAGRVTQIGDAPTAVAVPLITADGEVGFVQYQGANRRLSPGHCADLPPCDLLLLQGEIPAATSAHAARTVKDRSGLVLLNPAPVDEISAELLDAAAVLCPNEVEARALRTSGGTAASADERVTGVELARSLAAPGRTVVVTLGARGAALAVDGRAQEVSPPAVDAIDSTGAGDSFCAALGLALAERADPADAVRFACAAGAHSATVRGAEPGLPTREQVEALLRRGTRESADLQG